MSAIVWDGKRLAADKRSTGTYGIISTITKIAVDVSSRRAIGVTGNLKDLPVVLDWFFGRGELPNTCQASFLIYDDRDGCLYLHDGCEKGVRIEDAQYAIGSGQDFARSAMSYGWNAMQAVTHASKFISTCGDGCDYVDFGDTSLCLRTERTG